MDLPSPLAWLVDEAGASPGPERFLAELGRRLLADGLRLSGGALTLSVPHPIIARRTWLWRAETGEVIEALAFAAAPPSEAGRDWLAGLGPVWESRIGPAQDNQASDGPLLGWAGVGNGAKVGAFGASEASLLREVARFAVAPLAALAAREARAALLEAYLGRRSAARVQAGALARGTGETIRAALLCADLRDFTALSEVTEPQAMIAALDAYFDRVAGAVHAFGGEVLKFIGDGVLAIFPVAATSSEADIARGDREACEAALRAVAATRAGMSHLDQVRQAQGLAPLPFGAALHFGEILWGNIGAADRLDFTAIGPAVNLVSRLEGLCKLLGRSVLISGAVAANTTTALMPLGAHALRGIAAPCAVFTLPEA
ncbi:adenylate/guanylate cyclase domain-containing protein [Rhizobium phaseoli]|uniref:Adenylate/guanylate cyclase domain-containing protein n=1 Tax=Rhizobium phaseoli TaxID=396 RepID=A0A7K3UER7_9HYPH|nr:adenylate/guanylate cyclase domain-containing protein [Rhizobium phaseoli]NEJ72172.1 adenylate/guanylate cyclase domain-containing protein [Rhizobium phaseoli]